MSNPKFVLIVSHGRSGSTLLMSFLNTIPGSRITGENNAVLFHLFKAYKAAFLTKKKYGRFETSPQYAWYGAEEVNARKFKNELLESFNKHVLGTVGYETVIGFKEIRYGMIEVENLREFIKFALSGIRNSIVIVNTRDIAPTSKSSW